MFRGTCHINNTMLNKCTGIEGLPVGSVSGLVNKVALPDDHLRKLPNTTLTYFRDGCNTSMSNVSVLL